MFNSHIEKSFGDLLKELNQTRLLPWMLFFNTIIDDPVLTPCAHRMCRECLLMAMMMNTDVLEGWVRENEGKLGASTATINGDEAFEPSYTLSKQMLESTSSDCNGGLMTNAYEYILKSGGVQREADYPYTGKDGDGFLDRFINCALTFLPSSQVKETKLQDVDGFLDRFKLGFDEEKSNSVSDKLDTGEGKVAHEEPQSPPPPPEDSDEIFRKMKETGLIPNAVAMLHGLSSDGLVQEAMKLFGVMREKGSIPEVVIYTAVVEGFCKSQKPDEAIRIFKKMQNNGIIPNAFSYGVLVQGLLKGKRLDDAHEYCLEMVDAGHSPNLATFTGLVNAFCRERGLEASQIMINSLKEKGFGFDEKGVRDFMEKKGPFLPLVWEAIFGKKGSQMF